MRIPACAKQLLVRRPFPQYDWCSRGLRARRGRRRGCAPEGVEYAMMLARSAALPTITDMAVPGTAALEEVRKWSSVFSSHVSCAWAIAGEYPKPARLPAFLPITCASDGPNPFFPTVVV